MIQPISNYFINGYPSPNICSITWTRLHFLFGLFLFSPPMLATSNVISKYYWLKLCLTLYLIFINFVGTDKLWEIEIKRVVERKKKYIGHSTSFIGKVYWHRGRIPPSTLGGLKRQVTSKLKGTKIKKNQINTKLEGTIELHIPILG